MTSGRPGARWPGTLSGLLGIEHPIIQGPFGGFRSARLSAQVSSFGGLGSIGANALLPNEIRAAIAELRALTDRPFAVNLWVSTEDEGARASDRAAFERCLAVLAPHFRELGAELPTYRAVAPFSFEEQLRVVLEANVPVFSFIAGVPPSAALSECRARGIRSIGTASTPDEAVVLERAGVDAIVASGFEAGGHRGSFLRRAEDSLIGTFSLVPQIVDVVKVPVIAAGGVADSRGVTAAFALGAQGVQIGSALLACQGSGATALHRTAISRAQFTPTGLTHGFTGRLARGVRNQLMDDLSREGVAVLPYPLQRALVKELTTLAEHAGRSDLLQMWAGQSAGLSRTDDAVAFLSRLLAELTPIASSVLEWTQSREGIEP